MVSHIPEFSTPPSASDKLSAAKSLALAYQRTFSTPDGKRVLEDLLAKFPPDALRFPNTPDRAAQIDGQASVVREIQRAINLVSPKSNPE